MGERRMLARTIVESDAFLENSPSARFLYVGLCLNADDDGFVNAPKKICRIVGATEEDLEELIERKFVLFFREKGVVCIKHWWIHNYIPKDRHTPTKYQDLLSTLYLDDNKAYTFSNTGCIQAVHGAYTQDKLSKDKKREYKKKRGMGEENKPVYDDSNNPVLDSERLAELLMKRS